MWRSLVSAVAGRRDSGPPRSGNGASSLHLHWLDLPPALEASVELEMTEPPTVASLYFWALQASFAPGGGGAHLGLQWNPRHAGGRAVNWGGYRPGGGLLEGTESHLPSSTGNANTRTWRWEPHQRYRLRIHQGTEPGWWAGEVADLSTGAAVEIRQLAGGGNHLESIMVWSEVFADCDAPPAAVRWSRPRILAEDGRSVSPPRYRVAYQRFEQGGCTNTNAQPEGGGVVQRTATKRTTPPGTVIPTG